jgi:hypothetical protein
MLLKEVYVLILFLLHQIETPEETAEREGRERVKALHA